MAGRARELALYQRRFHSWPPWRVWPTGEGTGGSADGWRRGGEERPAARCAAAAPAGGGGGAAPGVRGGRAASRKGRRAAGGWGRALALHPHWRGAGLTRAAKPLPCRCWGAGAGRAGGGGSGRGGAEHAAHVLGRPCARGSRARITRRRQECGSALGWQRRRGLGVRGGRSCLRVGGGGGRGWRARRGAGVGALGGRRKARVRCGARGAFGARRLRQAAHAAGRPARGRLAGRSQSALRAGAVRRGAGRRRRAGWTARGRRACEGRRGAMRRRPMRWACGCARRDGSGPWRLRHSEGRLARARRVWLGAGGPGCH